MIFQVPTNCFHQMILLDSKSQATVEIVMWIITVHGTQQPCRHLWSGQFRKTDRHKAFAEPRLKVRRKIRSAYASINDTLSCLNWCHQSLLECEMNSEKTFKRSQRTLGETSNKICPWHRFSIRLNRGCI